MHSKNHTKKYTYNKHKFKKRMFLLGAYDEFGEPHILERKVNKRDIKAGFGMTVFVVALYIIMAIGLLLYNDSRGIIGVSAFFAPFIAFSVLQNIRDVRKVKKEKIKEQKNAHR